ncbi:MAG TPA: hypothetical protein VGM25_08955 [Caulobacteraceae bacterium]|jgi:hypothetical protein
MGNYQDQESFEFRFNRQCRSAYARWMDDPSLNVAMTLNFNTDISLGNARKAIGRCFCKVDRRLLGTRFINRRPERITGIFAFEHLQSNLHAHGLLRVKPERITEFAEMFPATQRGIWTEVWAPGSQWTTDAHEPSGFASYLAKEQRASSLPETMLFLEEFFPRG